MLRHDNSSQSVEIPLDIEEEAIEELFEFTCLVIYGDKVSRTMGTARAAKWKAMKKISFIRLPPDVDSLRQHCLRANYLAYLVHYPSLEDLGASQWSLSSCPPHTYSTSSLCP